MQVVEFNKKNENPFYGLKNCLRIYQNNVYLTVDDFQAGYNEVKDNPEKLKMFYSLCFSIGDITNRQHNIFHGKKKDSGGMSQRESFFNFVVWMWNNQAGQFAAFLNEGLFNEYNCFDTLLRNRVKSDRSGRVLSTYTMLQDPNYRIILAEYFYKVLNSSNPFNKMLIAKFLTLPRLGKRSKHQKMLSETFNLMKAKADFLKELSDLMHWDYIYKGNYANFTGYRNWRKEYNGELESVLFSTGKIKEFGKEEFLQWLEKLPAGARFRVRNRVLYSKDGDSIKWPELQKWYEEWEKNKEAKQEEQRILEEKIRQGEASEEDKVKLEKVKKEAKVNVGATNFRELWRNICAGNVDQLKLEAFVNKVNLPYNALVIVDDSGSMCGAPFNFATFMASVCLVKNPDDEGRNLFGMFNNNARLYNGINKVMTKRPNSLWARAECKSIPKEALVDPTKSFFDNYQRISNYMRAEYQSGGTNISSIPDYFKQQCDRYPELKDALRNYPVWVTISDNEFNSLPSPEASMNDFMRRCEDYFGYRPFIIAIDANIDPKWASADRFSGIDNMMYIPAAPEIIEQVLINFKDMDRFDVYTPLQSVYRSNRYELVRKFVLTD